MDDGHGKRRAAAGADGDVGAVVIVAAERVEPGKGVAQTLVALAFGEGVAPDDAAGEGQHDEQRRGGKQGKGPACARQLGFGLGVDARGGQAFLLDGDGFAFELEPFRLKFELRHLWVGFVHGGNDTLFRRKFQWKSAVDRSTADKVKFNAENISTWNDIFFLLSMKIYIFYGNNIH